LLYVVDVEASKQRGDVVLTLARRDRGPDGFPSVPSPFAVYSTGISTLPDPADRRIIAMLKGAEAGSGYNPYMGYATSSSHASTFSLNTPLHETVVPLLTATGRLFARKSSASMVLMPLALDEGPPWELLLRVRRDEGADEYVLSGFLTRGTEKRPLSQPLVLGASGILVDRDRVGRLAAGRNFHWIALLRKQGAVRVPVSEAGRFVEEILQVPNLPPLDLPEELRFETVRPVPAPRLTVRTDDSYGAYGTPRLRGELSFDYEGAIGAEGGASRPLYDAERRRLILRDARAEARAAGRLDEVGLKKKSFYSNDQRAWVQGWDLSMRRLPEVARALIAEGWRVEAEGKLFKPPGTIRIEVTSGIDWFDLKGTVDFDGAIATLPEVLAALKRGETTVRLGDGTFGLLPEEWLAKYGMFAAMGEADGGVLKFRRSQAGVLDALLASQPEATFDAGFARVRRELSRFEGVKASDPPRGFKGELRPYQKDGLGWLYFLQKFGLGGCLADDMGLGKTVQVLALLESRRALRARRATSGARVPPSLVVVPKSLVFNWKAEAARFAPKLHVFEYTGASRKGALALGDFYDVMLTTYGTLRQDAQLFKDVRFDYAILDESQAIKNAATQQAKAARLIRADHRLAMSGTPIENHLGELWSLFEFLNPGMLGAATAFKLTGTGEDGESRQLLGKALRPFILRRTKEQVAKDLPERVEQTIFCELDAKQRKLYDSIRDYYRLNLLGRVREEGVKKAQVQILTALLRLRQAACHPGLLTGSRANEMSAKLEVLLEHLEDVVAEGHKALVFSQFTTFLGIVRDHLNRKKVPYEYLDGRTRNRQERVERFQSDADCKLFLISLKAGGLGLNLTAAEYVFILDPWWNPAVEAQAIDRAHRIGQARNVFAYRLIARDTVEEKVLELQKSKRDLADAIITEDNSLIRSLGADDLELLLS
jgi:superfamily II DNA or RNA helicase